MWEGACSHILIAFLQRNRATCVWGACSHILTAFLQGNRVKCGRGLAPDSNLPVTLLSSGGERHQSLVLGLAVSLTNNPERFLAHRLTVQEGIDLGVGHAVGGFVGLAR